MRQELNQSSPQAPGKNNKQNNAPYRLKITKRSLIVVFSIIILLVIATYVYAQYKINRNENAGGNPMFFTVKRGDLTISVTECGNIKAVKDKVIKSEVEGSTTIVEIVPEGTMITEADVNEMVLVTLESSDLEQRLAQREIEFASAEAQYTEANEAYEIQVKQNESDITQAELKVKFGRMDFEKYLGKALADGVIQQVESDPNANILWGSLLEDPNQLGGEASQKMRELTGNIKMAKANLQKAIDTLNWTEKLHEKRYVAETELQKDRLEKQRLEIEDKKADIALSLYQQYEFPKQTEQLLIDYQEALRELERTQAKARSQLAQATVRRTSAEATYNLQKDRLDKIKKQIKACIIKAPAVGQVVYWSSMRRWNRGEIEQGADIRKGQRIIAIPDPAEMKVEIKIHETWIDKIEPNQPASIIIAAFPDKTFNGKVIKKAPLADPKASWEPSVKVYTTDVSIEGQHDFIKTGMTGKVEIIIDELKDVLHVPIQAVVTIGDKKVCYIPDGGDPQQREVETGLFNDNFVEIKNGLSEGERVMLDPPRWTEETAEPKQDKQTQNEQAS